MQCVCKVREVPNVLLPFYRREVAEPVVVDAERGGHDEECGEVLLGVGVRGLLPPFGRATLNTVYRLCRAADSSVGGSTR